MHTFVDADTLARLTSDIRKAGSDHFDPSMLANAPFLDEYALVRQPALSLTGIVTGHPRIPDGHRCLSTQIFYLDIERGVARTINRWYRLGRPHGFERQ
jgi:hypothetical protein